MMRPARIYAVAVNRVAHPIWRGLLVIRMVIVIAALCILATDWAISRASAAPRGNATPQDLRAQRQAMLEHLLTMTAPENIARDRIACLAGEKARSIPRARALGSIALPDVADYCVTVLIRSARDGIRSLLREADSAAPTSASALDNGFMVAYAKNEPLPAGLPTMSTLRPIAQRCLSLTESDVELCYAVGSAYGRRARSGETLTIS